MVSFQTMNNFIRLHKNSLKVFSVYVFNYKIMQTYNTKYSRDISDIKENCDYLD